MKFKIVLLLAVLLFIGCSDNSTAPAGPSITNPSPADGVTDLGRGITFEWDVQGMPSDSVQYDFYFGTTNNPSLEMANLTEAELISAWQRCDVAQEFLNDVYEAQVEYHSQNATYTGNGDIASAGEPNSFSTSLDLTVNASDVYTYTIVSTASTFTCTATANIDNDATIDTWTINQTGTLSHTVDDIPFEFQGNTTYYWKVVAWYGDDFEYESDVWSFTTMQNTMEAVSLEFID